MAGPSIQGSIIIRTDSVSQAIKHVQTLRTRMENFSQSATGGSQKVGQAIDRQAKSFANLAAQTGKMTTAQARNEALLAKAANKYAQFEAAVKKSGVSQQEQVSLLQRAAGQLKGYEASLNQVAAGTAKLTNVNTQLNTGFSQLQRDLSATSAATKQEARAQAEAQKMREANLGSLSRANIQYDKVVASVRRSNMGSQEETRVLSEVQAVHQRLQKTLQSGTASRQQISQAQRKFNETMNRAKISAQTGQMNNAAESTRNLRDEMRNLSTSVVVALGPLSGVASRLTALTALFSRNAAAVAGVFAGFTGFSVLLSRSISVTMTAEQEMARLASQLDSLGESARVSSGQLEYLAHAVAGATMTSAGEVRKASSVLLQFGGVARNQFEDVLLLAQGMSATFGGDLRNNTRALGRAIEDPVRGLQRLESRGVTFEKSVEDQIVTLTAQGKQFAATNVLLEAQASLIRAGKDETDSLSGAYDTLQGNLEYVYQGLFMNGQASEEAKKSLQSMADAALDFAGSDFALVLQDVYAVLAKLGGGAMNLAIGNIGTLSAVFAALVATTIPRLIIWLAKMGTSLTGLKAYADNASKGMLRFAVTTKAANKASEGFTKVATFMTNPVVGFASALATLVGTIWAYKSAADAAREAQTLGETVTKDVDRIILANQNLTKAQEQEYKKRADNLANHLDQQEKKLDAIRGRYAEEVKSTTQSMRELNDGLNLAWDPTTVHKMVKQLEDTGEVTGSLKLRYNQLNDSQLAALNQTVAYRRTLEEARDRVKDLEDQLASLKDEAKNNEGMTAAEDAMVQFKNQVEKIKGWEEEVFPNIKEMRSLQQLESQLEAARDSLKELANTEGFAGNIEPELKRVEKTLEEVRKKKEEVGQTSDGSRTAADEVERYIARLQEEAETVGMNRQALVAYKIEKLATKDASIQNKNALIAEAQAYVSEVEAAEKRLDQMEKEKERRQQLLEQIQKDYETRQEFMHGDQMSQVQTQAIELKTAGVDEALIEDYMERQKTIINSKVGEIASSPFGDIDTLQADLAQREQMLIEHLGREEAMTSEHWEKLQQNAEKSKPFLAVAKGAEAAESVVGGAMEAMQAAGRENTKEFQALSLARAVISQASAIATLWAEPGNFYVKLAQTALAGATVGAQIAAIKSQSFATGGYVSGPGSATSDSIPARLSNGEYVVKASAVQALGVDTLDALNEGRAAPFAVGGVVGVPSGGTAQGGNTSVVVNDYRSGGEQVQATETTDAQGNRQIELLIKDAVNRGLARGDFDRSMRSNYGVNRPGRRL